MVVIPLTQYCDLLIQRLRVDGVCYYYMCYFETLWHDGAMLVVTSPPAWHHQNNTCNNSTHCVHMPIMRSAVLCVSHSGDLVPDPQCSVPESRDIEILATHVSHYDLGMCV